MEKINWDDFEKVEIRVGTITKIEDYPEARKPAYKLWAELYSKEKLLGKQIIGVINFPSKQIGKFTSEFLTTGFVGEDGEVILAQPERKVKNGSKLV